MKTAAVIVAAGRGERAGAGLPKQWRTIAGRSVAAHTLDIFRSSAVVDMIVLVLHQDDMGLAPGYTGHEDMIVVAGGETRDASVRAGLEALLDLEPDNVLIHDVARPLVSHALIERITHGLNSAPAVAPALPVTDALWKGLDDKVVGVQDRTNLFRAQTPQGFHYSAICAAHEAFKGVAADDVEVARSAGIPVTIVDGEERNLKITMPDDFSRAENLLRNEMDLRVGNGFDVHRFGPGSHVTLCGVDVPYERGLQGHSDADVGMHALTDAIYGALAEGDIGQHFPPSDQKWKGANSRIFLEHAIGRVTSRGYRLANADVTLICETPKIGPVADEMRQVLASIMGVGVEQVSVKATTSERLGFTGRQEGIAAMASAALVTS